MEYDFFSIEKKWQSRWDEKDIFKSVELDSTRPKYYILDMFPYPSGDGLHVGHAEGYTATDILARYKRMAGFNVLHPMGWDAFGLPAEQYAIKTGTHPKGATEKNITNFKRQLKRLGFSYDWSREINTTDPQYYKWTQWIFRKLFEKGLAYESFAPVNWCPALGTVLANEEVIDGKSEVGGFPVEKKAIRQWVLKITEYAERLLQDLDLVDWPESTKEMQRNWIGKSIGAKICFSLQNDPKTSITVFSTRADTLFGVTFCVIAPEHPDLEKLVHPSQMAKVKAYCDAARQESEQERLNDLKEKTGLFTGSYLINPCSKEPIPLYVADYVLANYGTGAVMGVPGHDSRDHSFALKYKLPIKEVVSGSSVSIQEEAFTGEGLIINSGFLNGLNTTEAAKKAIEWCEAQKIGEKKVEYRLRDWIFSRQRFWGEPFPIVHDQDGNPHLISEDDLPLTLPDISDFKPTGTGEPPLAKAKDWVNITFNGKPATRETNIMPQWAGSCWYYLRFCDPNNTTEPWNKENEKYWLPVDLYVGGVEHANLHLLYARFWHKVLYDLGYVSTQEPFKKLLHPGLILGPNNEKMSKSRGNVVNPEEVIGEWGADSLRLFEMFLGPFDQVKPWQTVGITGVNRFLKRVWRWFVTQDGAVAKMGGGEESEEILKFLHLTVKKVTEQTESFHFNTAISSLMEFLNFVLKQSTFTQNTALTFLKLLSPYAPHVVEELWEKIGGQGFACQAEWPKFSDKYLVEKTTTISIMVNGKLRGTKEMPINSVQADVRNAVLELESVARHIEGHKIVKEVFVANKVYNFVVTSL